MRGIVASIMAVSGLLLANSAGAETIRNFQIGRWHAGAYTHKTEGGFNHCAASVKYNSGIFVVFSVNKNYRWSMGFANPAWKLDRGKSYDIAFVVDRTDPITATAQAISDKQVEVELADSVALFNRFRHGNMLRVAAAGQVFSFQLTDTSAVLPALLRCVADFRDVRAPSVSSGSSNNPFEKKAAAPAPSNSGGASDFSAEATTLAVNVLTTAQIQGFKFLAPNERGPIKADAVWRAPNVLGTLRVYDRIEQAKIGEVGSQLIASDAKGCTGTFFSGSIPETNGTPNARVFTTCQREKGPTTVYYLVVPRKAGGIYVFATASSGSEAPAKDADSTIRAAVFQAIAK